MRTSSSSCYVEWESHLQLCNLLFGCKDSIEVGYIFEGVCVCVHNNDYINLKGLTLLISLYKEVADSRVIDRHPQ